MLQLRCQHMKTCYRGVQTYISPNKILHRVMGNSIGGIKVYGNGLNQRNLHMSPQVRA